MPSGRQRTGRRGEDLAWAYLERRGWRVLAANVRTPHGELDLVACDGDTLVVVEVKTRRGGTFGLPQEAVTRAKRAHLVAAAQSYLQALPQQPPSWRIDVLAITLDAAGAVRAIEHLPAAVEE